MKNVDQGRHLFERQRVVEEAKLGRLVQQCADNLSNREFQEAGQHLFNITFDTVSPKET